ncbi:MAG TPA: methyltransferase domain-containing protein [Longimicrobiales bacterium]
MLHLAPEPCTARRLEAMPGIDYLSGDLVPGLAAEVMDITDIGYDDGSFDVIYCSHVLEHVPDDARAMAELCRVLRPDGWALFQVPVRGERTYEDWSRTTERERLEAFGQHDHVRVYGMDITQRLERAGFAVRVVHLCSDMTDEEIVRYGLDRTEPLFYCTRSTSRHA